MKKIIDPFIDFLPSIDLHGMDRVCARIKTEEFINDSIKLKNKKIVIIHGIGQGIVKDEVYKCLRRNKNVINFKKYINFQRRMTNMSKIIGIDLGIRDSIGSTTVDLKID